MDRSLLRLFLAAMGLPFSVRFAIPGIILGTLLSAHAMARQDKPNVVYILADDMGIGDVQAYNSNGKIPSPNIDRIAAEGMRFTDAHTNSSVCTPTRYGILTGRYAWRTYLKQGVLGDHSSHMIETNRTTVASFLKTQGYKTACFGKWHLGMDWSYKANNPVDRRSRYVPAKYVDPKEPIRNGPNDVGFDFFFGISGSMNMSPHGFIRNRQLQGELELVDSIEGLNQRGFTQPAKPGWVAKDYKQQEVLKTLSKQACDWIRDHASEPFFVYLPLPSPHSPIVPSEKFAGQSGLNPHGDFCMESDWVVGQVLQTLDELKLVDNTIVIFTSDNGTSPKANFKEMQAKGHFTSMHFRGLKGTTWEGGHRVPFVVRWPEKISAGSVCEQPICTTDLLATCAEIFDVALPEDVAEDSVSFLPALEGRSIAALKNRLIVHHSDRGYFAARQGKWKLMLDNFGGSLRTNPKDTPPENDAELLLFDIKNDPAARVNLAAEFPSVVAQIKEDLADVIRTGRSTSGPDLPTDLEGGIRNWPQLEPIAEYLNK